MEKPLVNRVQKSGIITINLEDYYPSEKLVEFDIKPLLFRELLLKEKDFRIALDDWDWTQYADTIILIHCSNDAIIPMWAYQLIATHAYGQVKDLFFGDLNQYLSHYYQLKLSNMDYREYLDKRVVIKGCGDKRIPETAFVEVTKGLLPFAKKIMYGEPCSMVPIYSKK